VELPEFLPLTALYVGRFPSTNHSVAFLWVSGFGSNTGSRPKRLVLVVVQDEAKPQPAETLQRWRWAMKDCPFFAPVSATGSKATLPFSGVCTFELHPREIVGLDYLNPLLMDASRLVVEATRITKRWFPTLESCSRHYGWGDAVQRSQRTGPSSTDFSQALAELYRPCPGDDAGGPPKLPQVVPLSTVRRLPSPQTYWHERAEERSYARLNRMFLTADRVLRVRNRSDAGSESAPSSPPCSSPCSPMGAPPEGEPDVIISTIHNLTVNFRFDDPFLPYVLREVVHDAEYPHLLRLYEAGLPSWAILLPQYTGLYRRSMRIVVSFALLVLSCASLLLGFYDLYRRIPAVRALLEEMLGPFNHKIQELVVVRLSVLLGWMLPYAAIFRRMAHGARVLLAFGQQAACSLAWLASAAASWAGAELGPTISLLVQPLLTLAFSLHRACSGVIAIATWLAGSCRNAAWVLTRLVGASLASPAGGGAPAPGLHSEFKLLRQACMTIYNCICFFGIRVAKHQASTRVCIKRCWLHARRRLAAEAARRPLPTVCAAAAALALLVWRDHMWQWAEEELPAHIEALCETLGAADMPLSTAANRSNWHEPRFAAMRWACHTSWYRWRQVLESEEDEPPIALSVEVLCGSRDVLPCWDSNSRGRRCHCPFRSLQGINITLDKPTPLALEQPRQRHQNGSIIAGGSARCKTFGGGREESARHCFMPAEVLHRILGGGSSTELLLLRPQGRLQTLVDGQAVAASFVLEAPRARADQPRRVSLCLEDGERQPWMSILPKCSSSGRHSSSISGGDECPAALSSNSTCAQVRATWKRPELGSCLRAVFRASLQLGRGRPISICEVAADEATVHDGHVSCSGPLPPAVSDEVLWPLGVRASVAVRCEDPVDAPPLQGRSPRYLPPEKTGTMGMPLAILLQNEWPMLTASGFSIGFFVARTVVHVCFGTWFRRSS